MINYNGGENMKKKTSLIISIVLIVVGCLVYFGYRYMTPKKVLIRTLNNYKESIYEENKHNDNVEKILKGDYKALDVTGEISASNQKRSFNINYNEDDKDKISQIKLDLNNNDFKINVDLVSTNKKMYIMIKDVFKKYYYTDFELFDDGNDDESDFIGDYINILNDNENVDTEKILELYIDSIDENISNSDFNSSKETIELDGKKIKTTKYTMTYDKKLNDKIINTFIKKVKNNNDASVTLSKLLNIEEKDLDKTLDNYLKELKDGEKYSYNVSVYTKLNKTYLIELELDGDSIAINKDKDTYNFIIKSEDNTITGKLLTHNKDKIKLEAKMKNKYYSMNIENVTDVTKSSSKAIEMNSETTVSMMGQSMKLNMKIALKEGKAINSDIIKDADKIENLTEQEVDALSKLMIGDSLMSEQFRKSR
jgi:hypothetical protein